MIGTAELNKVSILSGAIKCPQCAGMMVLKKSRFGPFYGCQNWPDCDATHGAHPDGSPMGKPGDKVTRAARKEAHAAFDEIWQGAHRSYDMRGVPPNKRMSNVLHIQDRMRSRCYAWLAAQLKMTPDECHIGAFDIETCRLVTAICKNVHAQDVRAWAKERGL